MIRGVRTVQGQCRMGQIEPGDVDLFVAAIKRALLPEKTIEAVQLAQRRRRKAPPAQSAAPTSAACTRASTNDEARFNASDMLALEATTCASCRCTCVRPPSPGYSLVASTTSS
jgi:hypothetical protein